MDIPHNALVIVADGRKLLLLRNKGDTSQIDLRTEDWEDQPDPKNREIQSDASGTQQQSYGYGRPALDEPDYHQENEDRFAAHIADRLNHMALAGKVKDIAVIAPAFSADCIETLEEINGEIRESFEHAGGEEFTYIPCLNDDAAHVDALVQVIQENLAGWT